ncbi:MAG: CHAT domain-containing protein, partial [Ilumatobacteraceae bacterium]
RLRAAPSLTIAPSAMWWLRGADDQLNANTGRVLLAHGPGLPNAATELDAIVGVVGRPALSLVGGDATVARVMSEAAAADLMHIAAHGSFRADNPMFSSLQLADGLLYVYDLQRLKHTPRAVILTACSAGASGVYSGDELLGTSIALLSLGVHSVIAPLLAVPDEATAAFAVAIHQAMQRGAGPDVALAMAGAAAVASGDPSAIAVAAAFQMIGIKI